MRRNGLLFCILLAFNCSSQPGLADVGDHTESVTCPSLIPIPAVELCSISEKLLPVVVGATLGISYKWTAPVGVSTSATNSKMLAVTSPGVYTLVATNTVSNCSFSMTYTAIACTAVEITDHSVPLLQPGLFPNPSPGKFILRLPEPASVNVINQSGELILLTKQPAGDIDFDIMDLSNGIYYVSITTRNETKIIRLLKSGKI